MPTMTDEVDTVAAPTPETGPGSSPMLEMKTEPVDDYYEVYSITCTTGEKELSPGLKITSGNSEESPTMEIKKEIDAYSDPNMDCASHCESDTEMFTPVYFVKDGTIIPVEKDSQLLQPTNNGNVTRNVSKSNGNLRNEKKLKGRRERGTLKDSTKKEVLNDENHSEEIVENSTPRKRSKKSRRMKKEQHSGSDIPKESILHCNKPVTVTKGKNYCGLCGIDIAGKEKLRKHKRKCRTSRHLFENSQKTYQCDVCHEDVTSLRNFQQHKRRHRETKKNVENKDTAYQCEICSEEVIGLTDFVNHKKRHKHIQKTNITDGDRIKWPLSCTVCSKRFIKQSRLNVHMLMHSGLRQYHCKICGNSFKHLSHLNSHMKAHEGEKPYICQICYKGFSEACKLVRHLKTHIRLKEQTRKEEPKSLKSEDIKILREVQTTILDRPYRCRECGDDFSKPFSLIKHLDKHSAKFRCKLCGKQFDSGVKLEWHSAEHKDSTSISSRKMKKLSKGIAPRPSSSTTSTTNSICSRTRRKTKKSHASVKGDDYLMKTDIEDEQFSIDTLGKTGHEEQGFPSKNTVGQTKFNDKSQNVTDFEMDKAEENMLMKSTGSSWESSCISEAKIEDNAGRSLRISNVMSGAKDDTVRGTDGSMQTSKMSMDMKDIDMDGQTRRDRYQCAYCDNAFPDSLTLELHIMLHVTSKGRASIPKRISGIKTHKCDYCGKSLRYHSHLMTHQRTHTGEKPFICGICGKFFNERSSVKRHMKIHGKSSKV